MAKQKMDMLHGSFEELLIGISGSSRYLQGYNRYERRT